MTTIICSQKILSQLSETEPEIAIEVVSETGSTNTDLLRKIDTLTVPTLRLALKQTAGRGRNGRTWYSEENTSLTFSLAWNFSCSPQFLSGLTLAVGVSIAETLNNIGLLVNLKWPNDLLKEGKKLAGILIELPTKSSLKNFHGCWAIVGIGLNLTLSDDLQTHITQPAAEALWLAKMDKNLLVAKLLDGLIQTFNLFEKNGLTPFIPRWNKLHAYAGKKITIVNQGRPPITGIATGIDDSGRLLLDNSMNKIAISAGDVSLRLIEEGYEHAVTN